MTKLQGDIASMKQLLAKLKENQIIETVSGIDSKFPALSDDFIIGMPRTKRDEQIQAIISKISADTKQANTP